MEHTHVTDQERASRIQELSPIHIMGTTLEGHLVESLQSIHTVQRSLPDEPFALCLIDGPALLRSHDRLESLKSQQPELFMPVVLVAGREELDQFTSYFGQVVDEVVLEPVVLAELHLRIKALLRAHWHSWEARRLHESEIRLQLQATRLENLSTNVPGMIYQFAVLPDGSTRFEYASAGSRDILEVEPEEVMADPMVVVKCVHPDEREEFDKELSDAIRDHRTWVWEGRYLIKGKTKWLKGASTPHDADYGVIWDGVMVDVTDRHMAEKKLELLVDTLQRKNAELTRLNEELDSAYGRLRNLDEAKSRFVATATHELRTPLTIILGLTQTILSPDVSTPEDKIRAYLQIVEQETKRLSHLVEILLSISRLESGKEAQHRSVFAVGELARSVRDAIRLPENKQLAIPVIEKDKGLALADRRQIGLVIRNILENAIRHSPDGGTIAIVISGTPEKVIVSVSDRGPGIPPDQQELIFEKFYRIRGERKISGTGSGLGLAVAWEIIKAHDEKIWVESEMGKGSTFCFSLPKPQ